MYAKVSRLLYNNGSSVILSYVPEGFGLFCKMPTLFSKYTNSMRFGFSSTKALAKFYEPSSWYGSGEVLSTGDRGAVTSELLGYEVDEDVYLTFVYVVYDKNKSVEYKEKYPEEYASGEGNYDVTMDNKYNEVTNNGTDLTKTDYIDKVLYYVNGELYGYTYYGHDSYISGCNTWNKDTCPFFVGVCPWYDDGNLYYLKGLVYSCRLYQISMTPTEVSSNRNATIQYRTSFLSE